ncbi:glycosyl transferase [Exophiala viscosa]|uniref:Glycosyl transferase n=1 Tax=Exophiala viscosa TaxID=2486360 RepID=A0AAN6E8U7_9EURO|nr:glycosyl transferase [Exophiala viscosa]
MSGFVTRDRQSSIKRTYERAKLRQFEIQRSKPVQLFFRYAIYLVLVCFTYFVLVGRPLWGGTIWYAYILIAKHLTFTGGSGVFLGIAFLYAYLPLLTLFETQASAKAPANSDPERNPCEISGGYSEGAKTTALLIPCYKSASLLPATLESALKVFPKENIFILANGNSPTPLDDTESVCTRYGVNHTWVPVGSKIVAQYVGCYVSKGFPYALLIDDDCLLPPDFPVVTERFNDRVKTLGYTITSTGPNHTKGTYCQQAQDLEYKLSGLQRLFAGKVGSATFAHGAIVLWDRDFLLQTFKLHPGFSISEDWFFGHVARCQGSRIPMCSAVFVETETPANLFFSSSGASRGGFGEMTVFKQRFKRWNFFFVFGMWYDMQYILCSWKLRPLWCEIGAKIFVFQEVYETLLYLLTPIVLPISFAVRPLYTFYLLLATVGLYVVNAMIFNEIHLRLTGRMVNRVMLLTYYMPFKLALTFVNVGSCYWSIWQYAKYFSRRHARIIEDDKAVGVVLKVEEEESGIDEESSLRKNSSSSSAPAQAPRMGGRRMTVTAVVVGNKGVVVQDVDSSEKSTAPEDSAGEPELQETNGVATADFAYRS